jgi:hypothetical protein
VHALGERRAEQRPLVRADEYKVERRFSACAITDRARAPFDTAKRRAQRPDLCPHERAREELLPRATPSGEPGRPPGNHEA